MAGFNPVLSKFSCLVGGPLDDLSPVGHGSPKGTFLGGDGAPVPRGTAQLGR